MGGRLKLSLFQRALERVLVLAGEIDHLRDLGFGDFVGAEAAHRDALLVDLQHDSSRILDIHREIALQDEDDELHWRVVVVEHQHLVVTGLLGPRPRARDDAGVGPAVNAVVAAAGRFAHHPDQFAHPALKYGKRQTLAKSSRSSGPYKNAAAPRRDGRTSA